MKVKKIPALIAVGLLAACNGPSLQMRNAQAHEVSSGGHQFRVFISGRDVEAVRTNFTFPANTKTVFPDAIAAMQIASGCEVDLASVTGDAAHIRAKLSC